MRARLLNLSKARNVAFDQILTRFALERLLYRLGSTSHRERFLLKGALMFDLWVDEPLRPTRDADFLGFGANDLPSLETAFREICAVPVEDGIEFDATTVKATEIRKDDHYGGVRITFMGTVAGARCPIQVDIGFGDAVTPAPEDVQYPVLLDDFPAPSLRAYPRYTAIAEKFEAIASLGMANSRMKDFFDLWVLTRQSTLDRDILKRALTATFERRGTDLHATAPIGLTDEFASDPAKQVQWRAFIAKGRLDAPSLSEVVTYLRGYFETTRDSKV